MDQDRDDSPPPYPSASRLNPCVRQATYKDAKVISAVHNYYSASTDSSLSASAADEKSVHGAIKLLQENFGLPYLVATVTLSQLSDEANVGPAVIRFQNNLDSAPDLELTEAESKAGERIIGYASVQPYGYPSTSDVFWRTAEIHIFVAPRYLHRGVGKALVDGIVQNLKNLRWIPHQARKLSDVNARLAASVSRWAELMAIVPIHGSGDRSEGESRGNEQTNREESQKKTWEVFGFEERGRLLSVAEKHNKMLDVWYFQKHLA